MAEEKKAKKISMPHFKMPHVTLPHIHFPHPHVPHIPHANMHRGVPSGRAMLHFLLRILNPAPEIGGLEITSSGVRFARITGDRVIQSSVPLPPGTLEDGKVKNKEALAVSLQKLHGQIAHPKEIVQIILLIPPQNVYTEIFSLPFLSADKLREAAHLNLQMISPLDIQSAYYDAEQISDIGEGGQVEFLGAFAHQAVVHEYEAILHDTRFSLVAVEFPALALARLIRGLGSRPLSDKFLIGCVVQEGGLQFFLMRRGNLLFHYVVPFKLEESNAARRLSIESVKGALVAETQKIFNFASSHWGGETINGFVIIAPAQADVFGETLTKQFALPVEPFALSRFSDVPQMFFPALGSALRGALPRSLDTAISLTAVGTERRYEEHRLLYFANVWRNIIVAFVGFFAVVYLIVYGIMTRYAAAENAQPVLPDSSGIRREITPIQNDAKEFNRLLSLYAKAKGAARAASPAVRSIFSHAQTNGITVQRMTLDSSNTMALAGRGATDDIITRFKDELTKDTLFRDVVLPLASISRDNAGVSFQIRLKVAR